MNIILLTFNWQLAFTHVDDVLIFSMSVGERMDQLKALLGLLSSSNISLTLKTCFLYEVRLGLLASRNPAGHSWYIVGSDWFFLQKITPCRYAWTQFVPGSLQRTFTTRTELCTHSRLFEMQAENGAASLLLDDWTRLKWRSSKWYSIGCCHCRHYSTSLRHSTMFWACLSSCCSQLFFCREKSTYHKRTLASVSRQQNPFSCPLSITKCTITGCLAVLSAEASAQTTVHGPDALHPTLLNLLIT